MPLITASTTKRVYNHVVASCPFLICPVSGLFWEAPFIYYFEMLKIIQNEISPKIEHHKEQQNVSVL